MSEFYDDRKVKAHMISRECAEKPRDNSRELPRMTAYNDWFEVLEEAESALSEARAAGKQGAAA